MTDDSAKAAPGPHLDQPKTSNRSIWELLGWGLSLFLTGLGAKLWLISRSGSPLPFWDQWPGEAIELFVPFFQHRLTLSKLFEPHGEHRLVFTRLCELGLMLLNQQWDSRLEMVFNAVVHAAGIAGLGCLLAELMGRRTWPVIWLLLVLDLAAPFAWENTLWGYQSQFYFLFIGSALTIWLLGLSEPCSKRWWCGVAAGIATLFTMGSGFLAAAVVPALAVLQWLKDRRDWRRCLLTCGLCAAIIGVGWLLIPAKAGNDAYQTRSLTDFLAALGKNLAWPWVLLPWYAPFNVFPFAALLWLSVRSRERIGQAELFLLGIGFWAILQCLAGAFYRGAGGANPAWRYMDPFSLLAIVSCLGICLLLTRCRARLRFLPLWCAASALWVFGFLTGVWFLTDCALDIYIPETMLDQKRHLKTSRAFMATGDVRVLLHQPSNDLIVPNVDAVVWLLRHPDVRRILPACVRDPLKIAPAPQTSQIFVPNGWLLDKPDPPSEVSWGSYSQQGGGSRGRFESLPIRQSALPYLEIPVAGGLGRPGLSLELVDIASGKIFAVTPPAAPGVPVAQRLCSRSGRRIQTRRR